MSNTTTKEKVLAAFGPVLLKKGYNHVDINKIAEDADVEASELESVFPSKALLCESWMELTDERTQKHHQALLTSGQPKRDILDNYFEELEIFMSEHGFRGCPFTNTSQAIRSQSEPVLEQRIKEHKDEVRSFFLEICNQTISNAKVIGEALFLMYSGATTESANLQNMRPVLAGRQAALALFDSHKNN